MNERLLIAMAADRHRFRRANSRRDQLFAATMLVPLVAVGLLAAGKLLLRPGLSLPSMVGQAEAQQAGAPVGGVPARDMPREPGIPGGPAPGVTLASPSSGVPPVPVTSVPPGSPPGVVLAAPMPSGPSSVPSSFPSSGASSATPVGALPAGGVSAGGFSGGLARTTGGAPAATAASAVTVLLEQASYWRNQQQYDQAVESLNRALLIDPNNRDALALLGQVQADRGNRTAAEAAAARLRAVAPDDPRLEKIDRTLAIGPVAPEALTTARQLASQGHQAEAVDQYNRVFKGNPPPDNYSIEYYQTLAGTESGWEQARDGLARAVRGNPQDLRAQLAYAEVLTYRDASRADGIARLAVLARNPAVADQATQAWRQALGWLPDNRSSLQPLTVYLQSHPDDSDLAQKLEMARNPGPSVRDPRAVERNTGFDALNAGRLTAAAAAFERALAQNPNDSDALGGLGIVRLRQRRFTEAKSLLARAIEANPGDRSHWQAALNGANRAIAGASSGGGRGGGGGPVYGNLAAPAQAMINRGDYAAAEQELRRAIATGRDRSGGLQAMLADSQAQLGRLGDAEASYRDALSLNPRNVGAMIGLAGVLSREGRSDESQKLLAQAEAEGGGRQAGQARALVLREQAQNITDPATQAAIYREAVSSDPSNPWIRLDLARALVKLRDLGGARSVMSAAARRGAGVDDLRAAIIFANETNDPDAAAALIARLPPSDRTPDMRALVASGAVQRDIAAAMAGSPQSARERLIQLATRPDPDGARGAAIARALDRLGDHAGAREAISLAQSATPGQGPAARIAYASALLDINEPAAAARLLGQIDPSRGLTAEQRASYARLNAGLAVVSADDYNRKGRPADAYDQLAPALARTPDNPDLNMALARIYEGARDPRDALRINEALLARDPSNQDVRRATITAALQAGDRARADTLVREGLQMAPNDPRMWISSADVAKAAGNTGRALRDLERARELRLQQLGYAENGSDRSTLPAVSLVPGAPAHVDFPPLKPVYVPVKRQPPGGNADGGADPSTLPWYSDARVIAQVDTGPAVPFQQAPMEPTIPAPVAATPPAPLSTPAPVPTNAAAPVPTGSDLRPPTMPASPNDARPGDGAAPPPAPDEPRTGRMLDTTATTLPPPARGATGSARTADDLNARELESVRDKGAPPPPILAATAPAPAPAPVTAPAPAPVTAPAPAPVTAPSPVVTAEPIRPPASPAPAYQTPVYQAPAAQPAVAQPPVAPPGAYQAPYAQAPAYQPPPYQPPAYQTPVYRPPSYYAALPSGTRMAENAPAPGPYYPPASAYPPAYYPPPAPPSRADNPLYAGPSVLNDSGGAPVGGYYANPFRPSPSGQPPSSLGFPATPSPLYQPDPETAAIDRDIIALRQEVAPAVQGGFAFRVRSGDSGLDKLNELDAPLTAEASPGGYGRLKVTATPTYLDAGALGGDATNQQRFGTGALKLLPGNAANNFVNTYTGIVPKGQYATGVGLDASFAAGFFTGDIGTSPLGFLLPSVVGGIELAPKLSDNFTLRLTGERRAITDSLLSYAGTRDPNSGVKWGGEDRTRGHANLEWGLGDRGGYIYVGGGGGTVSGTHVVSNTEAEAGAGGSFPVYNTPTQQLRVGLDLVYFGYNKNLRFFTLGQGGYFSPQSYAAALVPVIWKEQVDEDFSYEVGAAAGLQSYHENSSNYYPDDPGLQAQLVAQQANPGTAVPGVSATYPSQTKSGFTGNAHVRLDYRVSPNLSLGFSASIEKAGNYTDANGFGYARYVFNPVAVQ